MDAKHGHLSDDSQWSTYEANVQSYRGLSMSAQSLYLAVGAILLGVGDKFPFFTVFALAMATTWYVFFPVIFARSAIVDYYKFDLGGRFDATGAPRTAESSTRLPERSYASLRRGRALRARVYAELSRPDERFVTMRLTRLKLDLFIPVGVTIVWLVFAVYIVVTA